MLVIGLVSGKVAHHSPYVATGTGTTLETHHDSLQAQISSLGQVSNRLYSLLIPQNLTRPCERATSGMSMGIKEFQSEAEHLSRGRNVIEIDFEKSSQATTAAGFPAFDFFGDGSFFLLDTPGHAIGHMAALARTTSVPDTFILMGGDLSHHGGQLRPSKYMRIPASLSGTSFDRPVPQQGSCFEHVLHTLTGTTDQPFFLSAAAQVVDLEALTQTRLLAQKADADENIWVVCAHDPTVSQVAEFYPSPANDWQAKGWRSKTLWSFLGDIGDAVEPIDKIPLNLGAM